MIRRFLFVADNGQSSSILEFGIYIYVHHHYVKMIGKKQLKTTKS